MTSLAHPYPSVMHNGSPSYGGNQLWSDNADIRKCGCGLVAALDLIIYLCRCHRGCNYKAIQDIFRGEFISAADYDAQLQALKRRYLPLIPGLGMNAFVLVCGLNRLFHDFHMPYKAHWMFDKDKLWARMQEMLERDIPVILAIGPNFPLVWEKNLLPLYIKLPNGEYSRSSSVKAHFVTVTGLDNEWLCISSWGSKLYIKRREYEGYASKHSSTILSSALYIERI